MDGRQNFVTRIEFIDYVTMVVTTTNTTIKLPWRRNNYINPHLELELEFVLRPTVSRPVGLGIRPPFGTLDQILSCSSFV
jgi:hypothetical protein